MSASNRFERYKVHRMYENTYSIVDYAIMAARMYLLVGDEKALLIDSGYGGLDLHKIIRQITDKEVIAAITHGHLDHANGAYQFDEAYMHSTDTGVFESHSSPQLIRDFGYGGIAFKLPKAKVNNPDYRRYIESIAEKPRGPIMPLEDIASFDLGNRTVTWTLVPGHTPGSAAFIDHKYHTAFDSDAAPGLGAWLFLNESIDLVTYRENLLAYYEFLSTEKVTRRYVGHSSRAVKPEKLLDLAECCRAFSEGKRKGILFHMPIGDARVVVSNSTAMFFRP
ncbi:MAG: MBL fold metallo-hydrolase [Thermomicrobiales bacterium]